MTAAAPETSEKRGRSYVILQRFGGPKAKVTPPNTAIDTTGSSGTFTGRPDGVQYVEIPGTIEASSAAQAVRKHAQTAGAGTYVAIPAKTFKPVPVQVETVQRVRIGGTA